VDRIEIIRGDITRVQADAIVNAANSTLLGGGGVDGAIHRAAGPRLLEECRKLNGCPPGEAKITRGYDLPAGFVIHTVGPVWQGGNAGEPGILASCYHNSLQLAESKNIKSIAFPSISTGVYGYPKQQAAQAAIAAVKKYLGNSTVIEKVLFVVFDEENYDIYKKLLR
jgi:O-acetyl-ADP-ribose deacetylase (regulator of RNase III)